MASTSNSTSGKPSLTLPASEPSGDERNDRGQPARSYTDSFAQDNPGALYLSISDDSGALYATYPPRAAVRPIPRAGNGSDAITFQGSYADVQDIINSLTYVAAGSSGVGRHPLRYLEPGRQPKRQATCR